MEKSIELEIVDLTDDGSAVAKLDGMTVFADVGIPKDVIMGKMIKKKKNYMQAKTLKILKNSPYRQAKKICDIQGICGGCSLLDMKYEEQVKYKKDIVLEKLKRIGGVENPNIKDTIAMDNPYHYRNKSVVPIAVANDCKEERLVKSKNDRLKIPIEKKDIKMGFYKKKSHEIVPFTDCKIQSPINNYIVEIIKDYVLKEGITIYDETIHIGNLRHIVTKVSHTTGEIMLILVTNSKEKLDITYLISEISKRKIPVSTIVQNINTKNTNVVLGHKNITLYGKGYITDGIDGVDFRIYPLSFYQVNYVQMKKLYNKAFEYMNLQPQDVIYDLYSGIGTISLLMAKKVKKVYGIEVVKEAVNSARGNAKNNEIKNVEFICGKVEEEMQNLMEKSDKPNKILLDPARKGCEKVVLEKILQICPEKIVYISCNPSTLARDIKTLLCQGNYELVEVTPCDMFPNTMSIEAIAFLSRINKNQYDYLDYKQKD